MELCFKHKTSTIDQFKPLIYNDFHCLIETVDLVDEQDGVLAARQVLLGLVDRRPDILDAGQHRRQRDEFAIEGIRGQARQRGLAHARRPPQDHRVRAARLEDEVQRLALAQQVALADHFADGLGAQGFGQRRRGFGPEQVRGIVLVHLAYVWPR